MIDGFCSQSHYVSHLGPVLRSLPDELRGVVYVGLNEELGPACSRLGVAWARGRPPANGEPVLIAGGPDLYASEGRPVIFVEHGAGQMYRPEADNVSYTGGPGREQVRLFLATNQRVADENLARYPDASAVVVGDASIPDRGEWIRGDPPIVAVTFHWDANVVPETRWTWPNWAWAMTQLAEEYEVVGHAHPRAQHVILPWWAEHGIMATDSLAVVFSVADILLADNTSAAVEFARTGRPIVWLNADHYRRNVHFGGRFWEWTEWAFCADNPEDDKALIDIVGQALDDPPDLREKRRAATEAIYPYIGDDAARRAAHAIIDWL